MEGGQGGGNKRDMREREKGGSSKKREGSVGQVWGFRKTDETGVRGDVEGWGPSLCEAGGCQRRRGMGGCGEGAFGATRMKGDQRGGGAQAVGGGRDRRRDYEHDELWGPRGGICMQRRVVVRRLWFQAGVRGFRKEGGVTVRPRLGQFVQRVRRRS